MQTSARNHFSGYMTHIRRGLANDEVELTLAGGERLVTAIDGGRALAMRLEAGREAIAFVKASSVILTTENTSGFMLSARNLLAGAIRELHPGLVNTEVVIALKGEDTLVAIVTNESAKELGLTVGTAVNAIFKASDVILGVTV